MVKKLSIVKIIFSNVTEKGFSVQIKRIVTTHTHIQLERFDKSRLHNLALTEFLLLKFFCDIRC